MPSCIFYEPFYFELERVVNDSSFSQQGKAGSNGAPGPIRSSRPRLNLYEDSDNNSVTATFELPGASKDDVQLNFQNGKLTVSAESTKKCEECVDTGSTLRERRYAKFLRTLQLPEGVQDGQIKATMKNGLLTVTFPKTLPEPLPKKIIISDPGHDSDFVLLSNPSV